MCGSNSVSYRPIKDKNGYAKSLHRICQNCGKDLTKISLQKRASTLKRNESSRRSNHAIKRTAKRSRLVPGMIATIAIAVTSSFGWNALANFDGFKSEVSYQATSTVVQASTSTTQDADASVQNTLGTTKSERVHLETIKEKILRYSLKYDVDPREIESIVKCEAGATDVNKASTTIRSRYLEGTPRHERSFGLAQISLRNHPETSYDQAVDPDYALNFLTSNWKQHKDWWSCARILGMVK